MMMNGEYLENLDDLKRCFSFDELIYDYGSGELPFFFVNFLTTLSATP